ncbi:helix-turn-helix domain-containing protein [Staphylococcus xylosus]|uniref:helix-turn-helix domain-containing protein n=1 Tax=Staphylococcus xylosus TaxID=1288 RepID=UPI00210C3FB1|nr:helix-turn-helix domain-containing protein [Staphylococcus xylosus]
MNIMLPFFRIKAFFNALARFKQISHSQLAVYKALISYNGRHGCFPSHAILAAEAGVGERTVRNALREARLRGWIDWTNERRGCRQTANRYLFLITAEYANKVMAGVRQYKEKTAELTQFFRRQNLPGSPYFYIKQASQTIWRRMEKPPEGLTPWQKLFRDNREAAMAQLRTL